jgi:anaerobic ribonucleoside-triphosphate reductase activating protein
VSVDQIAARILTIDGIEGVTFSGGEPFAQAAPLAELGRKLKHQGLSVATFSGYPIRFLIAKNRRSWKDLLFVTDLLLAGPYIQESIDTESGTGISPQKRCIQLRDGKPVSDTPMKSLTNEEIEFSVSTDGQVAMTGFPNTRAGRYHPLRCLGG